MKRLLFVCLSLLGLIIGSSSAHATTLVSGKLSDKIGYWYKMDFGSIFSGGPGAATYEGAKITAFDQLASIVTGANKPTKLDLNFHTGTGPNSKLNVTTAELTLFDANGGLLLKAVIGPNGTNGIASLTPGVGVGAQYDFHGNFNVVGGSLFTQNLVVGSIFANFNYDIGDYSVKNDFHAHTGSFLISYTPVPPSDIPEPASSVLLLSSLAGFAARRRKAIKI